MDLPWHRLFGVALSHYFEGSPFTVELEKDLSLKQQLLDVVIIEKESDDLLSNPADGLDNLARHNLMTYKSLRQPLNSWALYELVGHYVNYRKQVSPNFNQLLPETDFRLYAVSTRYPKKLMREMELTKLMDGVYETVWGSLVIRIIVLKEIALVDRNAVWHLFSATQAGVKYGAEHYQWHESEISSIINQLFRKYQVEGLNMSYTIEDYRRERREEILKEIRELPPEEVIKQYSTEEVLKQLPPEEVLKQYSPEEVLKQYSLEETMKQFSPEQIEAYLKKLRQEQ